MLHNTSSFSTRNIDDEPSSHLPLTSLVATATVILINAWIIMKYIIKKKIDDMGEEGYIIYKKVFWVVKLPVKVSTLSIYGIPIFQTEVEAKEFIEDYM